MSKIGTRPNQIPVNGFLGEMAYQDPAAVHIAGGKIGDLQVPDLVGQTQLDGKVDKVEGKSLMTEAERTKLASVQAGATANDTDAELRDRANHTGTQAISTIDGLQTALDGKQVKSAVITTATSRTLALTDAWNYLRPGTASAITLTVPANSSVALDIGTEITIRAAGNVTLAAASGVTLNAPSGGTLNMTAHMTVTLKKVGTNVWDVIGQTVAA